MKKEKISIIVCAYNTEKYIERCIDSILNQTYKNIELVIVDDGSKDKTLDIINKYSKNKNVKIIKNEINRGAAYSRNKALEQITGDYVGFIDSDDYIKENYYEILLKKILDDNSDIVVCDINIVYEENNMTRLTKCGSNNKLDIINNGLAASCCNKLFKRELISKYKFSEGKINEDLAIVLPLIINAKKVSYTDLVQYQYVQRKNSVQNSKISDKKFDIFYAVDLTLDRIKGCKDYDNMSHAIIFQQIIAFFLYAIPKEKNIIRRYNILKKFNKLSKKYCIINNIYYLEFLSGQGKKHAIYYRILFWLNSHGLHFSADILILLYDLIRFILKPKGIKLNVNIDDLKAMAILQSKKKEKLPVSVIIPNYNYENFLYQRLYSILYQTEKINEIIILDDCSKDNSRMKIDEIVNNLKDIIDIKKVYNKTNSGSAFKQWEKGFNLAKNDYVWIAEADDYCSKKLLSNLVKPILKDKSIVISYSDTAFIDTVGNLVVKTIVPEIDIQNSGHFNKNFVNDGIDEFNNYEYLNCTIANVSSALIKKDDYSKYFKLSGEHKQCGDWLFYANVMHNGKVAYSSKTLNYYRLHGNNVSSVTKKESHMQEMKSIHSYFDKTYGLNNKQKQQIKKRYEYLKKVWELDNN